MTSSILFWASPFCRKCQHFVFHNLRNAPEIVPPQVMRARYQALWISETLHERPKNEWESKVGHFAYNLSESSSKEFDFEFPDEEIGNKQRLTNIRSRFVYCSIGAINLSRIVLDSRKLVPIEKLGSNACLDLVW